MEKIDLDFHRMHDGGLSFLGVMLIFLAMHLTTVVEDG